MLLLDTNIAIHISESEPTTSARLGATASSVALSLMTVVELEGGIAAVPDQAATRRIALDQLLQNVEVLPLTSEVVRVYGDILARLGFSRGRIIDRLIAATAIANDLTLATTNGPDFHNIPGLKLEIWPRPAQ